MSAETTQSNNWVQLQANVFTRWVQNRLKGYKNVHIDKITKDLSNGVALVELAETLTHKNAPRNWSTSPERTVDMVQNCDLAIDMFAKDGVDLVGISGKDINDNNEKLILGIIWSLILHYSIGQSVQINHENTKKNVKNDLQTKTKNEIKLLKSWAIDRTENYPNVHNFEPYELSMCALLDSYVPNKINYYSLNPSDTEHNSKLATNVMNDLGIPILIYPDDVLSNSTIDDKTLLTQLSCMKSVLESGLLHDMSCQIKKMKNQILNLKVIMKVNMIKNHQQRKKMILQCQLIHQMKPTTTIINNLHMMISIIKIMHIQSNNKEIQYYIKEISNWSKIKINII